MTKKRKRRQFTSEQKAALLRRHIVDKTPVSDICNKEGLQPSVFYGWLNKLMENASTVLESPRGSSQEKQLSRKVEALEEKLTKKDHVIAEVTEAFVSLKKELGEL
jgi:transposase-like protein